MSKEVYILGAGASCPFKFPTGDQLKWEIIEGVAAGDPTHKVRIREKFLKILNALDSRSLKTQYTKIFEEFLQKLRLAHSSTIDSFLNNNKQYLEIGKLVISYHIAFREIKKNVAAKEDNWVDFFMQKKIEDPYHFIKNSPIFITFNYDRSLQEAFGQYFENHFSMEEQKANELVKKIHIEHVYGKLDYNNDRYVNNFNNIGAQKFEEISKGIDLAREGKGDDLIYDILKEASRIYIIGYGFDKHNNTLLFHSWEKLKELKADIFSTSYLLPVSIVKAIERNTDRKIHFIDKKARDFLEEDIVEPVLFVS